LLFNQNLLFFVESKLCLLSKGMKKIIVLISTIILIAIFASACKSSSKCAAYGETQKFQKESRY